MVPEPEVAHRILLLNTEKAHNLRERALEVARLAEALAALDNRPEREYEVEFEEAALVTLGLCYQQNGRFSGGAYHPILKRCDKFLASKLPAALETRRERAAKEPGVAAAALRSARMTPHVAPLETDIENRFQLSLAGRGTRRQFAPLAARIGSRSASATGASFGVRPSRCRNHSTRSSSFR